MRLFPLGGSNTFADYAALGWDQQTVCTVSRWEGHTMLTGEDWWDRRWRASQQLERSNRPARSHHRPKKTFLLLPFVRRFILIAFCHIVNRSCYIASYIIYRTKTEMLPCKTQVTHTHGPTGTCELWEEDWSMSFYKPWAPPKHLLLLPFFAQAVRTFFKCPITQSPPFKIPTALIPVSKGLKHETARDNKVKTTNTQAVTRVLLFRADCRPPLTGS